MIKQELESEGEGESESAENRRTQEIENNYPGVQRCVHVMRLAPAITIKNEKERATRRAEGTARRAR